MLSVHLPNSVIGEKLHFCFHCTALALASVSANRKSSLLACEDLLLQTSPELRTRSSINQHFGSSAEHAREERAARGTCSWAPWGYPTARVGWNFPGSRKAHQAATASPRLLALGVGCGTGSSCTASCTRGAVVHRPLAARAINHLLMWCVCLNLYPK